MGCYGRTRKAKWENICSIVRRVEIHSPAYGGDTESDQIAALKAKTEFIHVTYGFGKAEAEVEFRSFEELVSRLI